jgi:hypothetical protein
MSDVTSSNKRALESAYDDESEPMGREEKLQRYYDCYETAYERFREAEFQKIQRKHARSAIPPGAVLIGCFDRADKSPLLSVGTKYLLVYENDCGRQMSRFATLDSIGRFGNFNTPTYTWNYGRVYKGRRAHPRWVTTLEVGMLGYMVYSCQLSPRHVFAPHIEEPTTLDSEDFVYDDWRQEGDESEPSEPSE